MKFNGVERLRHGRTASFGLDADGGHCCGERHDLRLCQSGQLATRGKARTHLRDLRFGRCKVIAKINDHGAETIIIVCGHACNVREPREGGCGIFGCHVRRCAEHCHNARKIEQRVFLNAKLASSFSDGGDLGRRCRDLRGHGFNCVRHICQFFVCQVCRFGDAGDGRLEIHRRLHTLVKAFLYFFKRSGDTSRSKNARHRVHGLCRAAAERFCTIGRVAELAAGLCKGRAKLAAKLRFKRK